MIDGDVLPFSSNQSPIGFICYNPNDAMNSYIRYRKSNIFCVKNSSNFTCKIYVMEFGIASKLKGSQLDTSLYFFS